jgi:hypothetical protein
LSKSCDKEELVATLHCATAGGIPFSKSLFQLLSNPKDHSGHLFCSFSASDSTSTSACTELGAARAAEQAGDAGLARQYYAAAVALGEAADPVRPEITAARAFVTKVN